MLLQRVVKKTMERHIVSLIPLYEAYLRQCKKIVDAGSGNGMQAFLIKERFPAVQIQCLDIGEYLWKEYKNMPLTLYDGAHMPFASKSVDACLLFFVLHHARDPEQVVRESVRMSRKFVFIFEEVYAGNIQRAVMNGYDVLVNMAIFHTTLSLPKFQTHEEWVKMFRKQKIARISCERVRKPWYYPPQRILYRLCL